MDVNIMSWQSMKWYIHHSLSIYNVSFVDSFYTAVKDNMRRSTDQYKVERITTSHADISDSATETSSTMVASDTSSDIVTKKQFSCKNFRIACHCGAANCKKFLFW